MSVADEIELVGSAAPYGKMLLLESWHGSFLLNRSSPKIARLITGF